MTKLFLSLGLVLVQLLASTSEATALYLDLREDAYAKVVGAIYSGSAGDVNGDGVSDILLVDPARDYNERRNSGSVYVSYAGAKFSGISKSTSKKYYCKAPGS